MRTVSRTFGRFFDYDSRDRDYLMRTLVGEPKQKRTSRYWGDNGWWGNQGVSPFCVAYSWLHWLEDGPIAQSGKCPCIQPSSLYRECQELDDLSDDLPGTTIRAGAKALQNRGFIANYYWAITVQDIVDCLLYKGPVVMGSEWREGMMRAGKRGLLSVSGDVLGGHAYILNGVNTQSGRIRLKNSWGRGWGDNGRAWLTIDEAAYLLSEDGEACIAMEVAR